MNDLFVHKKMKYSLFTATAKTYKEKCFAFPLAIVSFSGAPGACTYLEMKHRVMYYFVVDLTR